MKYFKDSSTEKDRQRAILGTILSFAFILVLFFIFGFKTPLPYPEEEGALIDFGQIDVGGNQAIESPIPNTEPQITQTQPQSQPEPQVENVVTQTESPVSATTTETPPKDTPKDPVEETPKTDETTTQTTEPTKTANKDFMMDTKLSGDKPGDGPIGMDPGKNGENTKGGNNGTGWKDLGTGKGTFMLDGRGMISPPPKVTGSSQKPEKIVVEIFVDSKGNVKSAKAVAEYGATLSDASNEDVVKAVAAAKKMTFNELPGGFDQKGYIKFVVEPR